MSSLVYDTLFKTQTDGRALGLYSQSIDTLEVNNLIVNNTFNGDTISGSIVFTSGDQYVTDKTFGGVFSVEGTENTYSWGRVETLTADEDRPLYSITTTDGTAYLYTYNIVAASGTAAAVFKGTFRAKNLAGVLQVGAVFNGWMDHDPLLALAQVYVAAFGNTVSINVIGGINDLVRWSGTLHETVLPAA